MHVDKEGRHVPPVEELLQLCELERHRVFHASQGRGVDRASTGYDLRDVEPLPWRSFSLAAPGSKQRGEK